jgi:hypothetical protein
MLMLYFYNKPASRTETLGILPREKRQQKAFLDCGDQSYRIISVKGIGVSRSRGLKKNDNAPHFFLTNRLNGLI